MAEDLGMEATEIITIKGSGLRGAKRVAAKAHNARIRANARRRDGLGRFVTAVNVDMLEIESVFVNDDHGDSHAHTGCGNLVGRTFVVATVRSGWLCESCVDVPTPAWIASHDVAPVTGKQTCATCRMDKTMRSFPTVLDMGWRGRGPSCRKCVVATRRAKQEMAFVDTVDDVFADDIEFVS